MARVHGRIEGLYILHPNNVGRCGHQANASYAVRSQIRGLKIGEKLLEDSLARAGELGYRLLIFNAVVKGNGRAVRLYTYMAFGCCEFWPYIVYTLHFAPAFLNS